MDTICVDIHINLSDWAVDSKESKREVEVISGTREEKAEYIVQKLADEGVI